MKLRHAVALATAGWYLMLPPLDAENRVDTTAPLSQWKIINSFDTADKCEEVLLRGTGWMADENGRMKARTPRGDSEICVVTDDPRLAH